MAKKSTKCFDELFLSFYSGVGGNLVAVQASRIATALHKEVSPGVLPDSTNYGCITTFCKAGWVFLATFSHFLFIIY